MGPKPTRLGSLSPPLPTLSVHSCSPHLPGLPCALASKGRGEAGTSSRRIVVLRGVKQRKAMATASSSRADGGEPSGCRAPNGCGMQIATLTGPCSPPRQRIGDGPCPEPRSTLLTLGGGGRSSKKSGNTSQSWSKVQHISLGRPNARPQGFPSPPSGRNMTTCGAGPCLYCGRGRPSCPTGLAALALFGIGMALTRVVVGRRDTRGTRS